MLSVSEYLELFQMFDELIWNSKIVQKKHSLCMCLRVHSFATWKLDYSVESDVKQLCNHIIIPKWRTFNAYTLKVKYHRCSGNWIERAVRITSIIWYCSRVGVARSLYVHTLKMINRNENTNEMCIHWDQEKRRDKEREGETEKRTTVWGNVII